VTAPVHDLVINGISLWIPGAWKVVDPTPLTDDESRGTDVTVPGRAGDIARTKVRAAIRRQLQLYVFGANDADGVAHGNVQDGFLANKLYLRANLLAHNVGTVAATYTAGSSTATGDVQVLQLVTAAYDLTQHTAVGAIDVKCFDGGLS